MRLIRYLALATCAIARPALSQAPATNEHGKIPVLEYHLIGDTDTRWGRSRDGFRRDLELLYARGYRPITVAQLVDKKIDLPAGTSPVVFTFDDASPSQFRYLEKNGTLEVDPTSAVGIWMDFSRAHADWGHRATFCVLPAAAAGHAFFGDKGVDGQQSAWRLPKLRFLAAQGFEICNHTLWHATLSKYGDAQVQEQIARGVLAIDSAVAGYRVRTFALPLGVWPKNRALAQAGQWTDPRTGRTVTYHFDAVLEVSGPAMASPFDAAFNALAIHRFQVIGNNLAAMLDKLEPLRFVSAGKAGAGGAAGARR
jgi:peptidoglycan/xylan/chitin deacetylase (PgdA/CDA1 family)